MTSASYDPNRAAVLGCIADDVTGATDLAINLVQGGLRVVQVLGVPDAQVVADTQGVDAIVVALKTRSIPAREAIEQSVESLRALQHLGMTRFYFKYCSTFDSTAQGNIGPVAETLMDELGVQQTIFCPAFPRAGRTVYRGHLFVGDELLNESGMQHHPLNPMTDANLVRCLATQSTRNVGLLSYNELASNDAAVVRDQLTMLAQNDRSLVITDTCNDAHLLTLARSVATWPLVTGGSGLARFLPQAYRENGILNSPPFVPRLRSTPGRNAIIAGSCSAATQSQVTWMQTRCPVWHVNVAAVMASEASELAKISAWARAATPSQPLLVASTAAPEIVSELQHRFGAEAVALAIERFLANVAKTLVDDFGVRRLVLAGGETSGAIVRALGIRSLLIGPEICAGVPWTESIAAEPRLALALKSGNFGGEDFFEAALEMLA